ncbi:hypothetical protein VTL71DRAFT_14793, partial [Oculimacula yallundae]
MAPHLCNWLPIRLTQRSHISSPHKGFSKPMSLGVIQSGAVWPTRCAALVLALALLHVARTQGEKQNCGESRDGEKFFLG